MSRQESSIAAIEDQQASTTAHDSKKLKNRLAQQKYRNNLKRRLRELEAVAATVQQPQSQGCIGDPSLPSVREVSSLARAPLANTSDLSITDNDGTGQYMLHPPFFDGISSDLTWKQYNDSYAGSTNLDKSMSFLTDHDDVSSDIDHLDRCMYPATFVSEGDQSGQQASSVSTSPDSLSINHVTTSLTESVTEPATDLKQTQKGEYGNDKVRTLVYGGRYISLTPSYRDSQAAEILMPRSEEAQNNGLEGGMRHVLDAVSRAGFENFDAAVISYYTETTEDTSAVYTAQKMSRNRHLPRVLRALRRSAQEWPSWEVNGYKDEIIQSAERILSDELDQPYDDFEVKSDARPRISAMDEFPHLWALMHSLVVTQSADASHKRHGAFSVLLTTLGRMLATETDMV